jgi:hypothetical protein
VPELLLSSSSSAKSSVGELSWQAQHDLMLNETLVAAYRVTSLIFFFRSPGLELG